MQKTYNSFLLALMETAEVFDFGFHPFDYKSKTVRLQVKDYSNYVLTSFRNVCAWFDRCCLNLTGIFLIVSICFDLNNFGDLVISHKYKNLKQINK